MLAAEPRGYLTLFSSTFGIIDAVYDQWQGQTLDCLTVNRQKHDTGEYFNDGKRLICIIFPLKFLENLMMWRNSYGKGIDNGKGSGSYEGHDG